MASATAAAPAARPRQSGLFEGNPGAKFIIITAILASLLEIIDTSIVNVAIPTMMGNLGATLEDISWVVTGYIIANAIVLPIAGWLGMRIGRRKYYVGAILFFTATSVACGLAPNLTTLVVFRVLQGLAGGALLPTSQALIQEQFPPEKAGMASAIYGMGVIIGPTIGPTLGGYLTDHFGWRMIFNINLPLGLLAAFLAYTYVEDMDQVQGPRAGQAKAALAAARKQKVDLIGLGLLALGVGCFQFVLERGQADDWFASQAIATSAVVAALAIPLFIWWELKIPNPILDLRLYKHPALRIGTVLMLTLGMVLFATVFVLPIFADNVLHFTATQTGMLFIPGAALTGILMPFIGAQLRKRDPRILIGIGFICLQIFLIMLTGLTGLVGAHDFFHPLLVRGVGMAFLFVPINTVVLSQFQGAQLGQVAGMMNLSRQIGGSIGIAALSTLLQRFQQQHFTDLTASVSLLSPLSSAQILGMRGAMASKMGEAVGFGSPQMAATKAIAGRIAQQAFILSFQQILWVITISIFIALIPLFYLKRPAHMSGPIDAH